MERVKSVEVKLSKMKIKLFLFFQLKVHTHLGGYAPGEYLTGTMPVATREGRTIPDP